MDAGEGELARLLLDVWDPLFVRGIDVAPASEYLPEARALLSILDAGGGQTEILEFLQGRHAELSRSAADELNSEVARSIYRWFGEDQAWLSALPPVVQAAARGALSDVTEFLRAGRSPNESDSSGWTALHAAATTGFARIVATLLEAGAVVDARSSNGFTPLLNAAGPCETPDVIALLLEAGADPNAIDDTFGWTPLSRAAEYCRAGTARLLISAGADVRWVKPSGFTSLMTAAEHGCTAVVSLLLEAGADRRATFDGSTAADMARESGFEDCAVILEVPAG